MISQLILRICLYISSTLGLQLYIISLVSLIFHIDVGIKIKSSLLNSKYLMIIQFLYLSRMFYTHF